MLLPGCDRCGQCGCSCGTLPYALTVEFSGLKSKTHTQYAPLEFQSNFGCGAAGVAVSPGGDDADRGPLTGVLLTEPGHDYARLGRRQPVLSVSGGSGSGAVFTVTLEAVDATLNAECRSYKIKSVTVEGGNGYKNTDSLTVTPDGVTVTAAKLTLNGTASRVEPTVTASAGSPGSGATLTPVLTSNGNSPETWSVTSVSVGSGGSGYVDHQLSFSPSAVTFATTGTKVTSAAGNVRTHISKPTTFQMYDLGSGSGAFITPTLSEITVDGRIAWEMTAATITEAGSGYTVGDEISVAWPQFWENTDQTLAGVTLDSVVEVTAVDGSGGVTGVTINVSGVWRYYEDTLESIQLTNGGAYYAEEAGEPDSVTVVDPGEYYTEDPDEPICVADIDVTVEPLYGFPTTPATITASVDDDPLSGTFGQITGLTIGGDGGGGSGYLAWRWICMRHTLLNGIPFVLTAVNPKKLVTLNVTSDFGSGACLRVVPAGDGTDCDPPVDSVYDGLPGPIREVEVVDGGSGYAINGPGGVEVANVTVEVVQLPPSDGSGATITVTIGTTPGADFGKVLSATITNGGSNYTILGGPQDCRYRHQPCGVAEPIFEVELRGSGKPPNVMLLDSYECGGYGNNQTVLRADDPIGDCDELPTTATLFYGAPSGVTATITRGGSPQTLCEPPDYCSPCPCPDFSELCFTVTITDVNGIEHTPEVVVDGNEATAGVIVQDENDDFLASYHVSIVCACSQIVIGVTGSTVKWEPECPTGSVGSYIVLNADCECPENWHVADETITLNFDCDEVDCSECEHVNDPIGTVRVQIANGPC